MIDFEKIGKRIAEERKYIHKISQEKMAEDLGMYQSDISNMEKAKKGSGITDLYKLGLIADYFSVPLETLLFGREDKNMLKYEGSKMQLKQSKKKLTKTQKTVMSRLAGTDIDNLPLIKFECGPYLLLTLIEEQAVYGSNSRIENNRIINPEFALRKPHTYVFFGGEVIAAMTADITSVMQHVFQPSLQQLQEMIQFDVFDVIDVWRTLNPYWALWQFSEEDGPEAKEYKTKMYQRMDEIRASGQDRIVYYVESIFVREDCRRKGICRMYIDMLNQLSGDDPIIWMNMEPTAGAELNQEYGYFPHYTAADIGQLNMNASIAEHLGFTVDSDTWHRQSEVTDAEGNVHIETVLVRKCAYYLPEAVRQVVKNDGDLVALGRAKQKVMQAENDDQTGGIVDIRNGIRDGFRIQEWKVTDGGEITFTYAAEAIDREETYRFGFSRRSPIDCGIDHDGQMETYEFLDDAMDSEYFDMYMALLGLLESGRPENDRQSDL